MERNLPQKTPLTQRALARSKPRQQSGDLSSVTFSKNAGLTGKPNLALFPFSALLPQLSEINELISERDSLKQRQAELLESKNLAGRTVTKEQSSKLSAEELMLNQVFQWLHVVQGQDTNEG